MEPMTLGSPNNSPAAGNNPYLPSFLMGDNPCSPSPRNISSYSPKKRSLNFAQSPPPAQTTVTSPPPEFNRSNLGQKSIFSHNTSISGPPIQGLFDSLHNEQNQIQTPTRNNYQPNQSYQFASANQSVYNNESYLSSGSFNASRIASPNICEYKSPPTNYLNQCPPPQKYSDFWVTVYGFPQSATALILTHFSQCGSIVDKVFPAQNGNWVHIKFSSCLEADRALNYNEKILANNIMIGVTRCKDSNIIDKENVIDNYQVKAVRPLSQVAYNSVQNESAVVTSPNAPQRSTGLVNKAMDLLFGW